MAWRRTDVMPPAMPSRDEPASGGDPAPSGSADQFERIFNVLPVPAWILDRATLGFLAVNDAMTEVYGFKREEFRRLSFTALLGHDDSPDARTKLGQSAPSRGSFAWRLRTASGESVLTPLSWHPVAFGRVPAILMVAEATPNAVRRLVVEAEEGRARLEALTLRLVRLQENERSQLARELHDEVGQLLTGLKLLLATSWRQEPPSGERDEVMSILSELMSRIRDLSMDLKPPMLEEIGLIPTLAWYFERYTARTSVQVDFRHDMEGRVDDAIELTAFRIIQEALTNVARYAEVSQVAVELRADDVGLSLVVEDRGRGFIPPGPLKGRSAGLIGMEERARLVGGHFTLESTSGAGTRIAVVLPRSSGAGSEPEP
jgi:signal transduction histidine kinase